MRRAKRGGYLTTPSMGDIRELLYMVARIEADEERAAIMRANIRAAAHDRRKIGIRGFS